MLGVCGRSTDVHVRPSSLSDLISRIRNALSGLVHSNIGSRCLESSITMLAVRFQYAMASVATILARVSYVLLFHRVRDLKSELSAHPPMCLVQQVD